MRQLTALFVWLAWLGVISSACARSESNKHDPPATESLRTKQGSPELTTRTLKISIDSSQFIVEDKGAAEDLSDQWTEEASDRHLAIGQRSLAVGTADSLQAPVTVEVLGAEPRRDDDKWDLVNECSIEVSTALVVRSLFDDPTAENEFTVPAGHLRLRISYGELRSLDEKDHYRIQAWPSPPEEPVTLKAPR